MKKKYKGIVLTALSFIVLGAFIFLNVRQPGALNLEGKWILVAFVPLIIGLVYPSIVNLVNSGLIRKIKVGGLEVEVSPSKRDIEEDKKLEFRDTKDGKKLPADYIFINHSSFLREEKQEEFKKRTNVQRDHYDIRIIVDSYYKGALEQVEYVQYYLHKAYPDSIQCRSNLKDKFRLKEIANGEYVLTAKVFLRDIETPLILERYIDLWKLNPHEIPWPLGYDRDN